MPVYKLFFKIIKKRFHIILIYLCIFMALSIGFSSFGKDTAVTSFQETNLNIGFVDRDQSQMSGQLLNYVKSNQTIISLEDQKESLQDALYYRNVDYILIIKEDFEIDFLNGKEDLLENIKVPNSTSGYLMDTQIEEFLQNIKLFIAAGYSIDDSATEAMKLSEVKTEVSLANGNIYKDKPASSYFFQYMPYVILGILVYGFGPVLITFYQTDKRKRMICASTPLRSFNAQLTSGCITFSLAAWMILLALGIAMFPSELSTLPVGYILLNTFLITLVGTSMGFLVGFIAKSENAVSGLANVISLGMAFLGGVFVPLELLSDKVLIFSKFLPTYWYIQINDLLYQTLPLTSQQKVTIYQGFGMQFVFGLTIFVIGLLYSKKQRNIAV